MAVLTAGGGLFAYYRSSSARSLLAGLVFGGIFASAGHRIGEGDAEGGFRVAALNSLALGGTMGYRFYKTGKVMPAGLLGTLGLISLAYHGYKYSEYA
jgi:uncharacterized membrane protein (UPF0136 family)